MIGLGDLPGGLIERLSGRGSCVKERDMRAIWRPLSAVDAAYNHDFVVSLGIFVAHEQRWWVEEKVTRA
jgi:hypothetical protein